jgi:hypothetical protein
MWQRSPGEPHITRYQDNFPAEAIAPGTSCNLTFPFTGPIGQPFHEKSEFRRFADVSFAYNTLTPMFDIASQT